MVRGGDLRPKGPGAETTEITAPPQMAGPELLLGIPSHPSLLTGGQSPLPTARGLCTGHASPFRPPGVGGAPMSLDLTGKSGFPSPPKFSPETALLLQGPRLSDPSLSH